MGTTTEPADKRARFTFWFTFYDVMHGAWALCLVIVAEVFSASAAIAEEYSRIV